MMFKLYHSGHELNVVHSETINNITKVASHNDHVFILTTTKQLFFGTLDNNEPQIHFELIREDVIDVACSVDSVYVVDENGNVQHRPLMAFDFDKRWNDIPILNYGAIYEGVISNGGDVVRVVEVSCNDDGALFITADRELYAVGCFNDVCTSDQPIKVAQFINYEILQIAMGKHFAVILTRKRSAHSHYATASHANHIDSSSCDDSITSIDNSLAGLSIAENESEQTAAMPMSDTLDVNSLNSVSLSNLKTITNNTDTESSSPDPSLVFDVEQRVGRLLKTNGQIQTQVWCFGSMNKAGQLGVGDHVKRMHAVEVVCLRDQGVVQICSGDEHTAALTLDARLYLWGDNTNEQISHWLDKEDCSSPKRFYKTEQNVFDVQCGQSSTYVLTNNLDRYELSRNKHFPSISISQEYSEEYNRHQSDYLFLASKQYLIVGSVYRPLRFEKYLKFEQQFLQDILQKTRPNIEHFLRVLSRNIQIKHPQLYRQFAQQYSSITDLLANNIASLLKFSCQRIDFTAITFVRNHTEYIHIFRQYCKCYCETICSDDFSRASQIIIPNSDFMSKFSIPLQHTSNYVDFIRELLEIHPENYLLKTSLKHWDQFRREVDEMFKSADFTIKFWTANQKNIPPALQLPERRFIIDSKEFSLKLLPSSRFKSNWFILFNDIFCHSTGSTSSFKQYSLKTLWISNVVDKDVSPSSSASSSSQVRKYAFKIVTPEEQFLVSASSNDIKMKWLQSFEYNIKNTLGKVNSKSNFLRRTTTYTFSDKHRIYPMCKYLGQWYYGKMDGIGCIEYPDGRIYTGQIKANCITGYGRLTYSNSDCYEGRFFDGKFHGYGSLETHQTNESYEGHFQNGFKHGFGILNDNMRTHMGEFVNGSPCGYGVMDDSESGEKYMGFFKDGNRCGSGFCITADGKYFEGNFIDNELNGNGVAMFVDGSYYEGDLCIGGPNGRGTLFLPVESVQNEMDNMVIEMDNQKFMVRGSILSGSLGGCWENVKINNGSITMNQEFGKYPSQFGQQQIDSQSKWSSLFSIWEYDVFGTSLNEINDTKKLWIKISDYMDSVKHTEVLKSTISTSAILYKSGGQTNKTQSNYFLHDVQASQQYDYHMPKSLSLSRITGKNFKSNLLAVERPKSLSNEFLNNAGNFSSRKDAIDETNPNKSNGSNKDDLHVVSSALKSPIPYFGISKLDANDLRLIRDYLTKAFKNPYHPLGILNTKISFCFYTSYGCWKVKPISILSTLAMQEWESISRRIYLILRRLFPTLPQEYGTLDEEFISHRSLLYPILLSEGVYSTLFVLYANKCSKRDEIYRQRIQQSEKKTDIELMAFLKLPNKYLPLIKNEKFTMAINALQQVKEKFCPREMLHLIEQTFKYVEAAAEIVSQTNHDESNASNANTGGIVQLNADNMMPLTIFLLLRAAIPHLGTEILLLEDLMGPDFEFVMNGFAGYCFTTIKAAYQHIIIDSFLQ